MSKKSIQDIKVKNPLEHRAHPPLSILVSKIEKTKIPLERNRPVISTWLLIIGIITFLGGAVYFISVYFSSVKIIIKEKSQSFTFTQENFNASKVTNAPIHFEITILSDYLLKDAYFTESNTVSGKAQGTVVIYNEYSTKIQNLKIDTRLADIDGRIYLLDKAVSIPGYTLLKGKIVPGSVEVSITASTHGESYNGDPRDFTFLGFKNTPKYQKIYSRSKTPLSGGSEGISYSLSPQVRGEIEGQVKSSFNALMIKKLEAEIPPGYILYPGATRFSYTINDQINSKTPNGKVRIDGSLSAILLEKTDLEQSIIKQILPKITPSELEEITVEDLSVFSFSFIDPAQTITKETEILSFSLSGSSRLLWHPNQKMIAESLVGVPKETIQSILLKDPGIDSVRVILRPSWQAYLPSTPDRIHITVE